VLPIGFACMEPRRVSPILRQIPNALTIVRFAAIPLFVWLLLEERSGPSWPAAIVFGGAAITDQLDGYLARRWRVESQFGKVADPLADRLMIDTAVVLLVAFDRLPWVALVILLRDLLLMGGYKLLVPRGYAFEVSRLGKIATWGLYASLGLVLVTEQGTWWPVACFWINLGLAVIAAAQYLQKARREVGR
jgi:CDP-diacylglycerol--glycerol-3-phosphate 3-phosphatidyltransferase